MSIYSSLLGLLGLAKEDDWLTRTTKREEEENSWIKRLQSNPHFQEVNVVLCPPEPDISPNRKIYRLKVIFYDSEAFRQMMNQYPERSIFELLEHRITDDKIMEKVFHYQIDAERFATRHFGMKYVETNEADDTEAYD